MKWLRRLKRRWNRAPSVAKNRRPRFFSFRRIQRSFERLFRFRAPSWSRTATQSESAKGKLGWKDYVNPISWIKWFADFVVRWFMTRPVGSFLPAVPCLIALLGIGYLASEQYVRGNSQRRAEYSQKLYAGINAKKYDLASLAVKALRDLSPDDEDLVFQYAAIENERGNTQEAEMIMKELLVKSKSGRAAFWLARTRFDTAKASAWSEAEHTEFRFLMALALQSANQLELKERQLIMAKYLIAINGGNEALTIVSGLVPQNPDLAISAALLAMNVGKAEEAKRYAATAADYLQTKLQADPTDFATRSLLSRALVMQEKEREAVQSLRDGIQFTTNSDLNALQAEALVAWANRLKRESPGEPTLMQRLNLVGEAVKVGGNLRFVSDAIIDVALECRKSENPNVKSLLVSSLKNVDPSVLHFIRGTIATFDGNMDKAVQYLTLAAEDGSNLPGVLNNLAVALHSKEGSDLNEALRFSELALKQLPDHPYFLETRGQILFKLGRTQEAIRDLEKSLQAEEIANVVLPTLIECYKKLNLEEMVQQYQMQLNRLGEKR